MPQKLINTVVCGDAALSPGDLQAKKTIIQSYLNGLDALTLAGVFSGTDAGARIASLQAQLRSVVAAELEIVTHRVTGTGIFRSPA